MYVILLLGFSDSLLDVLRCHTFGFFCSLLPILPRHPGTSKGLPRHSFPALRLIHWGTCSYALKTSAKVQKISETTKYLGIYFQREAPRGFTFFIIRFL